MSDRSQLGQEEEAEIGMSSDDCKRNVGFNLGQMVVSKTP